MHLAWRAFRIRLPFIGRRLHVTPQTSVFGDISDFMKKFTSGPMSRQAFSDWGNATVSVLTMHLFAKMGRGITTTFHSRSSNTCTTRTSIAEY